VAKRLIERLAETVFKTPIIDVGVETKNYSHRLESRLKPINGGILPYPSVTHQLLVERELKDLKPFQPKGTGYRDALIWYSLLEYVKREHRDSVLITSNTNDFAAHKDNANSMHANLAADLEGTGLTTRLEIRRSLGQFIDDFVKPVLQKLDEFKLGLERGDPVDLKRYLGKHFTAVFEQLRSTRLQIRIPGVRLEEPIGVSSLGDPSVIQIDQVLELNAEEVYIEFHTVYEANIFGFLLRVDAYGLEEDSDVSVTDIDWNGHYAEVEATVNLEVRLGAIYDRDEKDIVSLEVKEAKSENEY